MDTHGGNKPRHRLELSWSSKSPDRGTDYRTHDSPLRF
jgi:hypothetical protein